MFIFLWDENDQQVDFVIIIDFVIIVMLNSFYETKYIFKIWIFK